MPTVVIPASVSLRVVDVPESINDKELERSRKGALYIRPASTLVLTDDEIAFLKEKHKALYDQLIIAVPEPTLVHKLTERARTEEKSEIKKAIEDALEEDSIAKAEAAKKSVPPEKEKELPRGFIMKKK